MKGSRPAYSACFARFETLEVVIQENDITLKMKTSYVENSLEVVDRGLY
jgi:hypothetical protein